MMLVLLLYMLFASTFTMGKAALAYTTPIFFTAIRMFAGGTLLLIYQHFLDINIGGLIGMISDCLLK